MIDSRSSTDVSGHYDRLIQLARQAVRDAQQQSRDLGVPNVYSFNGQLLYELPNGELSLTRPESNREQIESFTSRHPSPPAQSGAAGDVVTD